MDIKSEPSDIELSPLRKYSNIEDWLIDMGLSKSWIKKKLTKKELKKNVSSLTKFSCDLLNKNMINPHYQGPLVRILHEDDSFLVLEKPAGIHGHPLEYSDKENVLSFIRSINKGKILSVNHEKAERGLLYRLDLETSGVLVYVKENFIFDELFKNRKTLITKKYYLALVKGKTESEVSLQDHIIGSETKGSKMKVDPEGKESELTYKTIKYDSEHNLSLIEVELGTGLRHQIRIQMSHSGHPLHGDVLYGGDEADRIYLHAKKYIINYNKEIIFESETPESFLFF
jgi:23S rRNA pseudouridine1911/1915/1917 synthase